VADASKEVISTHKAPLAGLPKIVGISGLDR